MATVSVDASGWRCLAPTCGSSCRSETAPTSEGPLTSRPRPYCVGSKHGARLIFAIALQLVVAALRSLPIQVFANGIGTASERILVILALALTPPAQARQTEQARPQFECATTKVNMTNKARQTNSVQVAATVSAAEFRSQSASAFFGRAKPHTVIYV